MDAARGLSPRSLHIHRLRQMPPAPQRLRLPSPLFFLRGVREKTAFPRDSRRLRRQLRNRNSRNRRKSAFRPPPQQEESLLWGFPRDGMKIWVCYLVCRGSCFRFPMRCPQSKNMLRSPHCGNFRLILFCAESLIRRSAL